MAHLPHLLATCTRHRLTEVVAAVRSGWRQLEEDLYGFTGLTLKICPKKYTWLSVSLNAVPRAMRSKTYLLYTV